MPLTYRIIGELSDKRKSTELNMAPLKNYNTHCLRVLWSNETMEGL